MINIVEIIFVDPETSCDKLNVADPRINLTFTNYNHNYTNTMVYPIETHNLFS